MVQFVWEFAARAGKVKEFEALLCKHRAVAGPFLQERGIPGYDSVA
jgi:hypothetical protein